MSTPSHDGVQTFRHVLIRFLIGLGLVGLLSQPPAVAVAMAGGPSLAPATSMASAHDRHGDGPEAPAHHPHAAACLSICIQHGKDPATRKLAEEMIRAQEAEIAQMRDWLKKRGVN